MPTPGPLELVIILVIALLILGPGKLPDVGAALGKSIREFRKASSDIQDSVSLDAKPTTQAPTTSTADTAPTPPADQAAPTAAPATPPPAPAAAQATPTSASGTASTDDVATASTTGPSSEPTPGTN